MKNISNRDQVIQVGSEMFLLNGFMLTSMDEVVKQSGVSKSNIYYHFKSKDQLAVAVLDFYIASLQKLFLEASPNKGNGSLLNRLEQYTDLLIQQLIERNCVGGCPLISMMVEAGRTNDLVQVRLAQFFQAQHHQLTSLFEEGKRQGEIRQDIPANALASLVTSWMEGALMLASIQKNASSLREERDAMFSLLKATS